MHKAHPAAKSLVKLLFFMLLLCNFGAFAQATTIWVVRHAEKDASDPQDKDPGLSAEGKQRAANLAALLKNEQVDAVFVTPYKRAAETGQPSALARKVEPVVYDPTNFNKLAELIKQNYKGKKVLVIGHSNTVIPIVNTLSGQGYTQSLAENDYDLIFKIMIDDAGKAMVTVSHYGKAGHVTNF